MSVSAALRPLAWSAGTALVAALLGWFVDVALIGRDIPGETAAVLGTVTLALGCLLGTRVAAAHPADEVPRYRRHALLLGGPAVLALAHAASSSPRWFGWLAAGGIVVASLCGLRPWRETGDDRENPYTTA
jgi:hypothetical protein